MLNRRQLLGASAAVGVGFVGLRNHVRASAEVGAEGLLDPTRYGPLQRDPARIIELPEGFRYSVVGRAGDAMDDGLILPGRPDGMAAFAGPDGRVVVVRNHEQSLGDIAQSPFGKENRLLEKLDRAKLFDATPALGGTSTFVYDPSGGRVEKQWLSLAGTVRNCAGGPTPWGSWVTCEEDISGPSQGYQRPHGYNFEVPVTTTPTLAEPVPLVAMGRFNHEAIAVDPRTGIVYQTEDRVDGLIYRFIPNTPGELHKGGRLEALVVRGRPGVDLTHHQSASMLPGDVVECEWVEMKDVESPGDTLRFEGRAAGAAMFARGEGMWFGRGSIFFACTNGGAKLKGQIWRYIPSPFEATPEEKRFPGRLELFVEPNDGSIVDNADNLCVAPWGELFVCEDRGGGARLVTVTKDGRVSHFGRNAWNNSELAGVCFSPDGKTLFVNIQHDPGMTLAITGPWRT